MNKLPFYLSVFIMVFLSACNEKEDRINADVNLSIDNGDTIYFIDRGMESSDIIEDTIPYVKTPQAAVKIARAVIRRCYGEECLRKEMPYNVTLVDGTKWKVEGTLGGTLSEEERAGLMGGVFKIVMNRDNGKILEVIHGK